LKKGEATLAVLGGKGQSAVERRLFMTDVSDPSMPVTVRNKVELAAWLDTQPRDVCVSISVRAALRALPLVVAPVFLPEDHAVADLLWSWVSALFRISALAWVAAKYPANEQNLYSKALSARDAIHSLPGFKFDTSHLVAYTADAVVGALATAYDRNGIVSFHASDALNMPLLREPFVAANYTFDEQLTAALQDANFLVAGGHAGALAEEPLWWEDQPQWVSESWTELRTHLPNDENWNVWTQWYDYRLIGHAWRGKEREFIFATVPIEKWQEGRAAANKWIADQLTKYEPELSSEGAIPAQVAAATQFTSAEGPIDVIPDPPESDPKRVDDQHTHYEEMRFHALDLNRIGPNLLGGIERQVARLIGALPDDFNKVSITRLWHRANGLRETLAEHDAARKRGEGVKDREPDPAELAGVVVASLRAFVESFNIFIVGDAKGLELERNRLGPGERDRDENALAAIAAVVADLPSVPDLATQATRETLEEQLAAGRSAPEGTLGDKDVALARDTNSNFVIALLRKTWSAIRAEPAFGWKGIREGGYREIGKIVTTTVINQWPQIFDFVRRHAAELTTFVQTVWNAPGLTQIIEFIKHLFV
jgi:hypothetical protein